MNPCSPQSGQAPVILLTGYRGLAETLIERLAEGKKYQLSVLVRRESVLPALQSCFPDVHFFCGDVSEAEICRTWVEKVADKYGRIDALINNAAITGPPGKLHEVAFGDFEEAIHVNLLAPIRLSQLVLPFFLKQGKGVLVNLSGGGATSARPQFSAYGTAKCALVRMTENLAEAYPDLRFFAVSPGALSTPMVQSVLDMDPKKVGDEYAEAKKRIQQGGEDPHKAANLILWLLKEAPQSLNGCLVSAIWDEYTKLGETAPGWWKLRRVDQVCVDQLKEMSQKEIN